MEAGFDHVLFTTDKQLEDTVTHKSLELFLDSSYDIERNTRTHGTVLALPRGLSDNIVITGPLPPYTVMSDIAPEVQLGDKIYFHYNVLAQPEAHIAMTSDNEPIYPVRYDQIYCAVRQEHFRIVKDKCGMVTDQETITKINPIGGWTLVRPIEQPELILPSGIIARANPEKYFPRIGTVAQVGTPFKGHKLNKPIQPGDTVLLRKNADFLINIEGTDYYVAQQRNILGTGSLTLLKEIIKNE